MGTTPPRSRINFIQPTIEQKLASSKADVARVLRQCQGLQNEFTRQVKAYGEALSAYNDIQRRADAEEKVVVPKYTNLPIPAITHLAGLSPEEALVSAGADARKLVSHFYHMEDAIRLIPGEIKTMAPEIELGTRLLRQFGQASSTAQVTLPQPTEPPRSFLRRWI